MSATRPKTPLTVTHSDLVAAEWDDKKNTADGLDPSQLTAGSDKKAWRRPPCCGVSYQATIRVWLGRGQVACPAVHGNLTETHPDLLAAEWDGEKNRAEGLDPTKLKSWSNKKAWRRPPCCDVSHQARIADWFGKDQVACPVVHGNLTETHPDLVAAEWDDEKNRADGLDPTKLKAGSNTKAWRRPPCCDVSHRARIAAWFGTGQVACPVVHGNLTETHPDLVAAEWDDEKNAADGLDPTKLKAGSNKKAWRRPPCCDVSHQATIGHWFGTGQVACSVAHGNLTETHPDLVAAEWDNEKNAADGLDPTKLKAGSNKKAWRQPPCCGVSYQAMIGNWFRGRAVCACQHQKWTVARSRQFLESLLAHAASFSESGALSDAEVWTIADRGGILGSDSKRDAARRVLAGVAKGADWKTLTGSEEPIGGAISGAPGGSVAEGGGLGAGAPNDAPGAPEIAQVPAVGNGGDTVSGTPASAEGAHEPNEAAHHDDGDGLPALRALTGLEAGVSLLAENADAQAVQFLIDSAIGKLWEGAYGPYGADDDARAKAEAATVAMAERHVVSGTEYQRQAAGLFLAEYRHTRSLDLPEEWVFPKGEPNLMQWHVASQVIRDRRVGNWSQAGTGKTLSAVLGSRLLGANLTVVVCPNAIAGRTMRASDQGALSGWVEAIRDMIGDSVEVVTGTLTPQWGEATGKPRFLIVQVEAFQREQAAQEVQDLLTSCKVDMVVIDEAHYLKRRGNDVAASRRRENVSALLAGATIASPDLAVLALTATPVVNELSEAVSILSLLDGNTADEDLLAAADRKATVAGCMHVHQHLIRTGTRFRTAELGQNKPTIIPVDGSYLLDDLTALGKTPNHAHIEQVLTHARIPAIVKACKKGKDRKQGQTVVYTEHVDKIVEPLTNALREAGLTVAIQTGGIKEIEEFKAGRADVLIGSSAVSTGVDGLQKVSHRLVLNSLPWTGSAWEQLVARLDRKGQKEKVEVIIPAVYVETETGTWNWDEYRWGRITNKRTIADAAVDGSVPLDEDLRDPKNVTRHLTEWLANLTSGASLAA